MAVKKPNLSADRAANLKKSSVRAGKAKGSVTTRQKQNIGVKDGTIRLGKSGKSYNVYDAKSGSWLKGVVKSSKTTNAPSSLQSTTTNKPSRNVTSAERMGVEGPKGSRTTNYSRVGFRKPGSRQSIQRVILNKPSSFPPGTKLRLSKTKNKDSRGRDVYRWVKYVG